MRYGFQPEVFKKLKLPWENTLFMGLELELSYSRNDEDSMMSSLEVIDKNLKDIDNNIFYYKDDCSISPGTEFVSCPFTLAYSNKKLNFTNILNIIKNEGFYESQRAGIHIHISKGFFSHFEMEKMRIFFSVNKINIFEFSGRNNINNSYCAYEKYSLNNFLYGGLVRHTRYAFNLDSDHPTIELRLFNSTTNPKKMKALLHFCDALSHFIKDVSIMTASHEKGWDIFLNWCNLQNRYQPFLANVGYKR